MLNTIDAGENALHIVIHLLQFCFLTQYTGLRMFQLRIFKIKTDKIHLKFVNFFLKFLDFSLPHLGSHLIFSESKNDNHFMEN